jgi:hypothetical protein
MMMSLVCPYLATLISLSLEAYPSNHLDAYRALDNPKFILLDEADFFRKSEQEENMTESDLQSNGSCNMHSSNGRGDDAKYDG